MKIKLKEILIIILTILLSTIAGHYIYNYIKTNAPKPHIVVLQGGLGNQMFQYAFAKALEKKTKRKFLFNNKIYEFNKRKYELGLFNIKTKFASHNKTLLTNNFIEEENAFRYDKKLFEQTKPSVFIGYFQNETYFKDIKPILKKTYKFPKIKKDDKFNQYWLKEIKSAKNPVFIHIRRDDYIDMNWQLPASYYTDAIKYIEEHVENPTYFIFGLNSTDFIKNELKLNIPYKIIDDTNHNMGSDWKDMMLMSKCKHAIIANSTFSWWAAWLGPNQNDGIVVAPSPFVLGQDEIICDNWVKIKRKYKSKP